MLIDIRGPVLNSFIVKVVENAFWWGEEMCERVLDYERFDKYQGYNTGTDKYVDTSYLICCGLQFATNIFYYTFTNTRQSDFDPLNDLILMQLITLNLNRIFCHGQPAVEIYIQ